MNRRTQALGLTLKQFALLNAAKLFISALRDSFKLPNNTNWMTIPDIGGYNMKLNWVSIAKLGSLLISWFAYM